VFLHRLPEFVESLRLPLDLAVFWVHGVAAIALLSLPALLPLAAQVILLAIHKLGKTRKPRPFIELAYGYLPLVLLATLAHYLRLGLTEAGRILPVGTATIGLSGVNLPILVAHPAVVAFLQGTCLVTGALLAIALTQKIARYPLRLMLPQHICTLSLTASLWWLIV
ncbi:MAG: AAA family ATPase, partial [Cyanobacteria bacterium J06639_14]